MDLKKAYQKAKEEMQSYKGEAIYFHPDTDYFVFRLKDPIFTSQHLEVSSRMLSYYEDNDILCFYQKVGTGWKQFSFFGLIWLYVIGELRTLGFKIENIKKLKDNIKEPLFEAGWDSSYQISQFEFAIADRIRQRDPLYLIAFSDGAFSFMSEKFKSLAYDEFSFMEKPHISIPLSKIIIKAWDLIPPEKWNPKPKLEFIKPEFIYIGEKEADVLNEMMSGKYERIVVRYKDQQPELIEMHEIISAKERLNKILEERKYQDIQIKQKDGKIVYIERISKKRL